jgi:hypothetical protein
MRHPWPGLGSTLWLALVALVGAASLQAEPAPPGPPGPRVTMITDSVGGALYWLTEARAALASGFDFDLETKTCRKLVEPGCGAYGDPAPVSALETVRALGTALGPILVIDVGYNDRSDSYAASLDEVMGAAVAAGVQHVIWLTLEEREGVWAESNAQIWAATTRWPELTVADWAAASAGQPWFVDEAHLNSVGGAALGAFIRPFLIAACGSSCATPPPQFCGLALTSNGFDAVQAAGLACSVQTQPSCRSKRGSAATGCAHRRAMKRNSTAGVGSRACRRSRMRLQLPFARARSSRSRTGRSGCRAGRCRRAKARGDG